MKTNNKYSNQTEELLAQMTLEEKVQLCHGATKFSIKGISRFEIPDICMSDGPHGVRREIAADSWDPVDTDEDFATYLPTGTAVAATWSLEMGALHGKILGAEARERGKDIILGPGFNIIRNPLCGRNFEYYSEDPCLISKLVPGAVQAIQNEGTAACVKHFACNSQELNRNGVNAVPSERALREIYLPGFKAAVDAGVLTVMGAYNQFRGQWCCQNDYLLNQILKSEWEFEGTVISDWNGVMNNTWEPAYNGMDMEMGTHKSSFDDYYLASPFLNSIKSGEIEEEILNDKVRRILHILFSIGSIGEKKATRPKGERNTEKHHKGALKIAQEAIVLLKNENNTLPFSKDIKKVLVVGDNAVIEHHGGGASSAVKALYEVTPLEGITRLLGDSVEIEHIADPAPPSGLSIPTTVLSPADLGAGVNGWKGMIFNQRNFYDGQKPDHEFAVNEINYSWEESLPEGVTDEWNWHIGFITKLTAPKTGTYRFILDGAKEAGLNIDSNPLILRTETESEPNITSAQITLQKGEEYELFLYIIPNYIGVAKKVTLTWLEPGEENSVSLEDLSAKAAEADAVIYVGGLTHQEDTEGKDRVSYGLPGMQDEVIPALAETNHNFAALMMGGSPYAMPWLDKVPALVHMWFAGMEGGTAAAQVLFGDINPSGKLPFTFPEKIEDSPAFYLDDYNKDICYYKEDIFTGYRWYDKMNIEPLFCFGYGLSYTQFEYSGLEIVQTGSDTVQVSLTLKNSGKTDGTEVVQLYLYDVECSVARPVKELKAFKKVFLKKEETQKVTLNLTKEDFMFFHPTKRKWMLEAGEFKVYIGGSSRDVRVQGSFAV